MLTKNIICYWIVTFLIVIISIEIIGYITIKIIGGEQDKAYLLYYKNEEWGKQYFKEYAEAMHKKFVPFVEWQSKEYYGRHINIESRGLRKTWTPQKIDQNGQRIYAFGGSTLLGQGSRDDFTIPSYLSKYLFSKGFNYIVYNYGEDAYVFRQEIIRLLLLLKDGYRPNIVIFYDGANDVYSAYQSGLAGSITNASIIGKKLESSSILIILHTIIGILERHSIIYKTYDSIYAILFHRPRFSEVAANYDDNQLQILAINIVEEYNKSLAVLDHLARVYDFKYICLWQPVIFTEKEVKAGDGCEDPRLADQSLGRLHIYADNLLKEKFIPNFFNLSEALSDRNTPVYIDDVHLKEEGNRLVSEKIFQLLIDKKIITQQNKKYK